MLAMSVESGVSVCHIPAGFDMRCVVTGKGGEAMLRMVFSAMFLEPCSRGYLCRCGVWASGLHISIDGGDAGSAVGRFQKEMRRGGFDGLVFYAGVANLQVCGGLAAEVYLDLGGVTWCRLQSVKTSLCLSSA